MATSTDLEAGASDSVAVAWRELRADDLPSLRLLDDHLFPVKYTDSFYRRLLSDGYFVVVAVAPSGEVVAVASARTVRYEDGGPNPTNDAYIMTLGVRDTFRRHRLARAGAADQGCASAPTASPPSSTSRRSTRAP